MSYREVRNFVEIMRALGDPRVISLENFQRPNFELVADCLEWLVHRYDPTTDIEADETTAEERVKFLKAVGQVMYTKARLKLNLKKLYAADGLAVKEMLKVAQLLYQASRQAEKPVDEAGGEGDGPAVEVGMTPAKLQQLREARQLTSEITQLGSRLYEALGRQEDLRDAWRTATGLSTEAVAEQIQEKISSNEMSISNMRGMLDDLERDQVSLGEKLRKRQEELSRQEKRLADMQRVRPAYMDEYERKQAELQSLYEVYVQRIRNLEYLEGRIGQYRQQEADRLAKQQRQMERMRRRIQENELRLRRGDNELEDGDEIEYDEEDEEEGSEYESEAIRGDTRTQMSGVMRMGGNNRVLGHMAGGDSEDESEVEDGDSEVTDLTGDSEEEDELSQGGEDFDDEDEIEDDEEEEEEEDDDVNSSDDGF